MSFQELKTILRGDLDILYESGAKNANFWYCLLAFRGFRAVFLFRLVNYAYVNKNRLLFVIFWVFHRFYSTIHNFELPYRLEVDPGFRIWHSNGIVINDFVKIGKNCQIFHQVTIGNWKGGQPVIGDNVYIYPGAKIFGDIKIGNNVVIGANAVVTKDIPDNCVTAGVPSKILRHIHETEFS